MNTRKWKTIAGKSAGPPGRVFVINGVYVGRTAARPRVAREEQRQSIQARGSGGPPHRQEGGAPSGGKREVDTAGAPTTSHTSKFQAHLTGSASKGNFKPKYGSKPS